MFKRFNSRPNPNPNRCSCVTSCHLQSKLRSACQKSRFIRFERRPGGPLAARDCELVPYKYAIFFVPECGVPRQVVKRLSIGPAPSGAFPLVRVRCRPGALLLLFFFLPSSSFFLISPRLDFSFYNVVIPELCFLFYNNRGHYTGLILVCIPFPVFERNFVFYSVQRRSPHNDRASISHFRHKSSGFVWFAERPLLPTGQCSFVRKIPITPYKCRLPSVGSVSSCRNRTVSHRTRSKLCDEFSLAI